MAADDRNGIDQGPDKYVRSGAFKGRRGTRFQWEASKEWVRVGRFDLPLHLRLTVRENRYPVVLEVEVGARGPQCRGVHRIGGPAWLFDSELPAAEQAERAQHVQEGPPLTGALLRRLPLMRLMREGLEGLATEVVYAPADQVDPLGLLDLDPDGEGQVLVRRQAYRRPEALDELQKELTGRRPQRGARITDDQLREVAMVYRAALAESEGRKAPTEAVRDMFTISRSTAGRWVEEARRRGFLGPAPGRRRAGEAGR